MEQMINFKGCFQRGFRRDESLHISLYLLPNFQQATMPESIDFEQNDHCANINEQHEYQIRLLEEKVKNFEDQNKALVEENNILNKVNTALTSNIHKLSRTLKSSNHVLKKYKTYSRSLKLKNRELLKSCKCKKLVFEKLLTSDTNVLFYTGCENLESFEQLHSAIFY